jgi:hypothetical protein
LQKGGKASWGGGGVTAMDAANDNDSADDLAVDDLLIGLYRQILKDDSVPLRLIQMCLDAIPQARGRRCD